jgi:hypothetical protein
MSFLQSRATISLGCSFDKRAGSVTREFSPPQHPFDIATASDNLAPLRFFWRRSAQSPVGVILNSVTSGGPRR